MTDTVSIRSGRAPDKARIIAQDDPTRGNLFYAIATGRVPANVAARLRWVDGCWTYNGLKDRDGYGVASVGGSYRRVHRVVYEAVNGAIPDGYDLHHERCRVKACADPRHVVAMPHGKHSRLTRMAFGARLSMAAAEEIRRHVGRGATMADLAERYGVHVNTIRNAAAGRAWKASA